MKEVSGLETAVAERSAAGPEMDFSEASSRVQERFGWKPGFLSRAAIEALSRIMRPLEQGAYEGRLLSGGPHRARWVAASPLNVFVLPRAGSWRKIVLCARLRHTGLVNVLEAGPGAPDGQGALEELIAIQRESVASIRLIPVARTSHQLGPGSSNVSAATKAYRAAAPQSVVRRASSLVRTFRTARVKNCRPVVLARWLAGRDGLDVSSQAGQLRVELMGQIESQTRACAGPPVIPVWEAKRRVLADPLLAAYMQEYALGQGATRDAVLDEARGYVEEIASDYRVGVVRWFTRAVDFMFDRFLTGLDVDRRGIEYLSECDSRSRLVLVCSHKSYLDPLLIGYAMFRSGLVPPQQAAGLNLNFWPVGWLLRHSGAFYLRRTFAGETLYREVFSAYVRYLLAENHIIVVYIEGTRSRDGKLALPRTGFLQVLDESMKMGICPDIRLVPVYLGYDRTPEESAHVKEMAGGRKVSESVKGFSRIYRSINTRLGKAYVKFGDPMSMRSLVEESGIDGAAAACCQGIGDVAPVTARAVAASALLASGARWVPRFELEMASEALLEHARLRGCTLATDADEAGVMDAVEWLVREGHVTREWHDDEEGFAVEGNGRRFLEYNKNMTMHHYVGASLEALACQGDAGDAAGNGTEDGAAPFLRDLFTFEFVSGLAVRQGERAAAPGPLASRVLSSLLESYVEGYEVAARAASTVPARGISRDELTERCMGEGERMLRDGAITRVEAVSKTIMVNASRKFVAMGALVQTRQKNEAGKDRVLIARGPAFDELSTIEKRLRSLLCCDKTQ